MFYIRTWTGSHSGIGGLLSTAYRTRADALEGLYEMGASLRRTMPRVTFYELRRDPGVLTIRYSDGTVHPVETTYTIVEVQS